MRTFAPLAAAVAWPLTSLAAPPIVGVAEAGSCPTAAAIADAITQMIEVEGRPAAAEGPEGEFLLIVRGAEPTAGTLSVELRSPDGGTLIARDLATDEASCGARARTAAVVVQRYLEAMTVPPAGMQRAFEPPLPLPPPIVRTRAAADPIHVEVRAGFSHDIQISAATDQGVALDLLVQPWRWGGLRAGGSWHFERSEPEPPGEVHASRHEGHLGVGTGYTWGRLRAEAGLGGRLDVTSVSTDGLAVNGKSRRWSPGALANLGASVEVRRTVFVFASVDSYLRFREESFQVAGLGEVERVSRAGLATSLGLAWRIR